MTVLKAPQRTSLGPLRPSRGPLWTHLPPQSAVPVTPSPTNLTHVSRFLRNLSLICTTCHTDIHADTHIYTHIHTYPHTYTHFHTHIRKMLPVVHYEYRGDTPDNHGIQPYPSTSFQRAHKAQSVKTHSELDDEDHVERLGCYD